MAKKNNPTGLSTGQGKGAAQVFGNTYNPYFKERLTEAKKKDKEVTDAMAKVSDTSQLWSRDVGAFKPMVNDLQKFYRDNARAIIKGDFDATLKLKQKQNEMAQYVTSSKDSQKFFNNTLNAMINNPGKYYKKDVDNFRNFGSKSNAGNFDYSQYGINQSIDVEAINKGLQDSVSKMGLNLEDLRIERVGNENVLVDESSNKTINLEPLIDQAYMTGVAQGGQEQADEYLNQDWRNNQINSLSNFLKQQRKTTIPYKVRDVEDTASGQKAKAAAQRRKEMIYNIKNNVAGTNELDNFIGKFNPSIGNGKFKVIEAEIIEPNGEDIPNRAVRFKTEDNKDHYYDVTEEGFDLSFNSIISNFKGQANLDDNALSKVGEYTPESGLEGTSPVRRGSLAKNDMKIFLLGKDRIEDYDSDSFSKAIGGSKSSFVKTILKKKELKSSNEKERETAFGDVLTQAFKGKSFNNKEIIDITADSPVRGSDYIILTFKDGTKSSRINLDDKDNSLTSFLNSVYDESASSKKGVSQNIELDPNSPINQ